MNITEETVSVNTRRNGVRDNTTGADLIKAKLESDPSEKEKEEPHVTTDRERENGSPEVVTGGRGEIVMRADPNVEGSVEEMALRSGDEDIDSIAKEIDELKKFKAGGTWNNILEKRYTDAMKKVSTMKKTV